MDIYGSTDQQQGHDNEQGYLKGLRLLKTLLWESLQTIRTSIKFLSNKMDLHKATGYQKGPVTTHKILSKDPDHQNRNIDHQQGHL